MFAGLRRLRGSWLCLAGAACLTMASEAEAQYRLFGRKQNECLPPTIVPCPPAPVPMPSPAPSTTPGGTTPSTPTEPKKADTASPTDQQRQDTTPQMPQNQDQNQNQNQEPSLSNAQASAVGGDSVAVATPSMVGDQLSVPALAFARRQNPAFPPVPGTTPVTSQVVIPSVRGFKIAENESPRPRDRFYLGFNYFDNVNADVNTRLGSDFSNINVYRETFGFEKTFFDGATSLGLRLPLNTLTADSTFPGAGGTSTGIGDLSVITKWAFYDNRDNGLLLSTGLVVTAPTGPDQFADSEVFATFHSTILQPYLGYIWSSDRFFLHGFLAVDIPTESQDVTLLHNDIGMGYYLYRNRAQSNLVTAIIPTAEVHVNNPLNHRGAFDFTDPAGTPDWVSLTFGTTFELNGRSTLAVAFNTPVTGPRPYDYEVLVQFNLRFGQSAQPSGANVIGN